MAKYMLLIYGDPALAPAPGSAEEAEQHQRWMTITEELGATGGMLGGDALFPAPTAKTVRERDGERIVTDGPFAETKEVLGGYYLVDLPSEDDVVEWAARMPNIHYGSVEVREVVSFD